MSDSNGNGSKQMLMWVLHVVWGVAFSAVMLWVNSVQQSISDNKKDINDLKPIVYQSQTNIESFKGWFNRIEEKIDRLISSTPRLR